MVPLLVLCILDVCVRAQLFCNTVPNNTVSRGTNVHAAFSQVNGATHAVVARTSLGCAVIPRAGQGRAGQGRASMQRTVPETAAPSTS